MGYGIAKSHSEAAALFATVAWPDNVVSRRVIDRIGFKDTKMKSSTMPLP
jgi:hypothetical protein